MYHHPNRRAAAILPLLFGIALSLGTGARPAQAQLSFTLLPTTVNVTGPTTLTFTGTLKNNGAANLSLNGDSFSFSAPGATLDDTAFFNNVPLFLTPSQSVSVPIFTITLASPLPANSSYSGTFNVLGGANGALNNLGSQRFTLVAAPSVPEASTLPALGAGLSCLALLTLAGRRRRGSSGAGVPAPNAPHA